MDPIIAQVQKNFESIKKEQDGFEFWSARDLSPLLGYKTWAKFQEVIKRAQDACKTSEQSVSDHFSPAPAKSTGGRPHEDYFLTRYACYLVAQNGDPRKTEIALAQTYFATQTRRQELFEARTKEDRRLEARQKLKETESKIETTVYARGIKLPQEFATFKNKHIEALYGGIGISDLKKKRKIPPARALADFDTHVELKAKDFALAMTDHNIKEKNLSGKYKLEEEVVKNSKATRQTLLSRGIRPEDLRADEDLKKIEQRRKQEQKLLKRK
ncbi:MAG: DNA damage-inducible protein D [Parcubacteria group bacterium]|nr:DNA damage-inducible protein D [Parcubacteria group bacterium]